MKGVQPPPPQSDESTTRSRNHERRQLWHVYTSKLVNTLTAYKSDTRNPLVDYLLPRALERPMFRSAILYLAFVMKARSNLALTSHHTTLEQDIVTDVELGSRLEQEALSEAENTLTHVDDSNLSLNTLATLLIVCNAYIAASNSRSLLICSEQAFIIARKLSGEMCCNEEFIFLVQCLGYMHTAAMLSPGNYNLKAPDFLSIISSQDCPRYDPPESPELTSPRRNVANQTDFEVRSQHLEALAIKRLRQEFKASCFSDIIPTTGISRSMTQILYNIGRLGQTRSTVSQLGDQNHWFWETFEADLDGLELQLDQILIRRNKYTTAFEASVNRLNLIEDQSKDEDLQHTIDLNRYNDALVHCARIVLLERVKRVEPGDERITTSTQRALSLCSLIPDSSHTAKLLVFPLFTAGMLASTPETRSFVRSRFQALHDVVVADTRALLEILGEKWATPTRPALTPRNHGMQKHSTPNIFSSGGLTDF
ncbi:fungal-specific transcription factor domain-containing protein [Penicillium brevicompactum]|uniref:Fungal-specific transcription factor domain-containing protein n=1 Tax=Penicillium brevicompactum TaxID=5074 RepID=A0A9W9UB89_PENBR|nr:fungal-specific transcription factor domain-containing protein [Penicillium brevicompactum]